MADPTGRFVWHDLMTRDVKDVAAFYTELFGWEVREVPLGDRKYAMIHADGKGIGGIEQQPKDDKVGPHWLAYVEVDELGAAIERVEAAGGGVRSPRMPIPDVGEFAVVTDPLGAALAAFKSARAYSVEETAAPRTGTFCWEELLTTDPKQMVKFYGEVLGWGFDAVDFGPLGLYHVLKNRGHAVAGIMQMPPDAKGKPQWLSYVAVDDVDATTRQAEKLAATRVVPPTDIPEIGRFAVLGDPAGASIGIFRSLE